MMHYIVIITFDISQQSGNSILRTGFLPMSIDPTNESSLNISFKSSIKILSITVVDKIIPFIDEIVCPTLMLRLPNYKRRQT